MGMPLASKGSVKAAQIQRGLYLKDTIAASLANVRPVSLPPTDNRLKHWWERLQHRGQQLGEDGMEYGEWAKWMDELDQFKREAGNG